MFSLKLKKYFCFYLILLIIVFCLCACSANLTGHKIVGIWEHEGNRIEFTDNGYFKKGKEKYTFSVTDSQVTIDTGGEAMTLDYSINANGTLTMNGIIYYPVGK